MTFKYQQRIRTLYQQHLKLFRDSDGVLNFKEFLIATHETVEIEAFFKLCTKMFPFKAKGSPQQKLRWQFRLYDKDGSGSVELKEMVEILVMVLQNDYSR